jgi:hypothetical protein
MPMPPRRAWLRIFGVRCGLPCDPPVGGHFMQWKDDTTLPSRGQSLRAIGKSYECSRRPLGESNFGHCRDVRCKTAFPPQAEVHRRPCYVAGARPCGTRRTSRPTNVRAASMYQASKVEQFAPGHHGYPRASETRYRKDLEGPLWHPVFWLRRADRSSISSIHLADLGGNVAGRRILILHSAL